ncbi:MAG: SufE family protein [Bacteroidales bacterium]|nr:SufE family protein [Bacteroidales bacterium]
MTIQEISEQIVEEFSVFDEWLDKYEYLIETGRQMPPIAEEDKTAENLIEGCQSRVWLNCQEKDGRLWFTADSDAVITKGIITLLIRVFDGQTPEDIAAADLSFIDRIGLKDNLSPTRANGLVAMITKIKAYALAFLQKEKEHDEQE